MLTGTGEHYPGAISTTRFEMGTWGMTKPMPESSREMSIVANNNAQLKDLPSHAPTLWGSSRAIALQL